MTSSAATGIHLAAVLVILGAASDAANACCDLQSNALPVQTAKERLSSKARDEQRVNDCKVPVALRGDRHRPADCDRTSPVVPHKLGKDE